MDPAKFSALCFNRIFSHVHYSYAYAFEQLKLHKLRTRKCHLNIQSLFQFTLVPNSVLLFWKLLLFEFLLGVSDKFLCSMSAVLLKTVLLLDALPL
jgi:hypothetical protein